MSLFDEQVHFQKLPQPSAGGIVLPAYMRPDIF